MPSALETLVKVLKLEREQGFTNKAMQGGLSAYSQNWSDNAHAQARKPEHHALVDEVRDRLQSYDSATRDDRMPLVNYLLDRIVGRQPMPPEYKARLEEYAQKMAEGIYPNPAAQAGPGGQPSTKGETQRPERPERQRDGERREPREKREKNRGRERQPEAAANVSEQQQQQRPPRGERPERSERSEQRGERPQERSESKSEKPQQQERSNQQQGKNRQQGQQQQPKQKKEQRGPQSQSHGDEGSQGQSGSSRDDYSTFELEFRGGTGPGKLDLTPRPRLTRVPRAPRKPISAEEAADIARGLAQKVETITGVGDKMAELLNRLGIETIQDFLYFLPRRYDDYTQLTSIARLTEGKLVTVIGTIVKTQTRISQRGRKDFVITVNDGTASLDVVFFGQFYLGRTLQPNQHIVLRGRTTAFRNIVQLTNPEYEIIDVDELKMASIVPVYPLTEGLSPKWMRRTMQRTIEYWAKRVADHMPEGTLERADLPDLSWTLQNLHFPESMEHLHHAKRRHLFDQLILIQLAVLANRRLWQSAHSIPLQVTDEQLAAFEQAVFPYPLTGAQKRAIADIRRDAAQNVPMNRLLQGDVGAGKTAVATTALAMAFMNGKQSAIMAPTSILAEQHYRNISRAMEAYPAERKPVVALLTSAVRESDREVIYRGLSEGSIDIVIGTHAIIQENVEFKDLAMAVIDEQHRFGVEQRGMLRSKGTNPHLLAMTATPIPRTLALTLYADLDLSLLDELPPGRRPVSTRLISSAGRERAYQMIEEEIERGHQAFIVYPLVEASDSIEAESAIEAFEHLKSNVFRRERLGLLHGRMKPAEKDAIMAAFRDGDFDILVTTSVAEVGVDIPNATIIMIEGANRFGLATLHQFRGRVGRSGLPSTCLLLSDAQDDASLKRLNLLEQNSDGFKLAEEDWKLRGAGDLVGTRQSGSGAMIQLAEDLSPELVELAQREAKTIYADDPDLQREEHRLLAQRVAQIRDERSDLS